MSGRQREPAELVIGSASEIPPGAHKIVRVRNMEVGVYNVGGEYHALRNLCPHQFGPVCEGPVGGQMICNAKTGWRFKWQRDGEILTCPWHGLEFDLTTGMCLTTKKLGLRRLPVRVVDGEVRLRVADTIRPAEPAP